MNLQDPRTVIAFDPGDVHVGVALWSEAKRKVSAAEWEAGRAVDRLDVLLPRTPGPVVVVVEEFRLYSGRAVQQSGSKMETAQMIGAMKFVCKRHGVVIVEQRADTKKPTRAQLRGRGIKLVKGKGGHAIDAQLHLWHYLLRHDLEDGSNQ